MLLGFLVVLLSTLSTISLGCTEESCLLATHPALKKDALCEETQLPGPVEPREKVEGDSAMKRWLSSWKSQLAYNAFKMYTILFINTAIGGMLGDIIGTMFSAFWPPKFSKEQAIMQAMMEWTQNYVQMALDKEIKESIAGKMCKLKMQVDEVKKCTHTLVQKIKKMLEASGRHKPDFPQSTLLECLSTLRDGAKATAWDVATQIASSSHRGVLGGEFAAISWSLMGIWRQIYYLRRLEEGHYDEFPDFAGLEGQARSFLNSSEWGTSEGVRKEMVNQSKALLGTAKDIRKAWEEWRFAKVKVKAWTESYGGRGSYPRKIGFIELTDQLTDTNQIFRTEKKSNWPEELEQQKWQDVVFENYKKMLYIKEFIPTMQTMPYLKQLIPGQEKDRPEPAPFDEFILLRLSAFLAGTGKPHMNEAALREGKWMLAPDKVPDNGPIEKMSALQDDVLRQLTFMNNVGHEVVLGTPTGDPQPEKHLPKKTCGLDLGYHNDWMVRITFLNAEKEAEVAELKAKNRDETAIFSTGVGLCGLYTFDRPTHKAKDFGGTGDAFEVQFRWDPDESGNHK